MDRLTHKGVKNTVVHGNMLADLAGMYFPNKGVSISDLCYKLGVLEDIEEELGISIIEAKYVIDNADMTVGYTHSGKPVYTDYGYIEDFIDNLKKVLEDGKND